MPPHQLYHSAHSCHLDHFLFSPKFFIIRAESCQPPERCAAVQIPSRRRFCLFLKAPQRFFFSFLFFLFLKGGWWRNVARLKSAEKTLVHPGCTCVEPAAAAAAARWCPLLCASSSLQTLHSICCCCALRKRSESKRRGKKRKKKKKKPRSSPLDCTEIKVTVWRCLQAGDITVWVS